MVNSSCKISKHKEVINYLGCPIGYGITPIKENEFLLGKVRKQLRHWNNQILFWDGRVVMLRNVLCAIPSYHLLIFSSNKKGYHELEQVCRSLLWGSNEEGNRKKALIAWQEITRPEAKGGLDIHRFEEQVSTLMRHVAQLIDNRQMEWTKIARHFIKEALRVGPQKKERNHWTISKEILLDKDIHVTNSPTTQGMLKGWADVAQWLTLRNG